jgi:hypothetical protein
MAKNRGQYNGQKQRTIQWPKTKDNTMAKNKEDNTIAKNKEDGLGNFGI